MKPLLLLLALIASALNAQTVALGVEDFTVLKSCTITKLAITAEDGLKLPALLFVPKQPGGKATLYLHGSSMKEDAAAGGRIEQLLQQGHTVLAAELRGIGETALPAAALDRDAYKSVALREMIPSWKSMVGNVEAGDQAVNTVLKRYDLADLREMILDLMK
jgi:hypothetical protein